MAGVNPYALTTFKSLVVPRGFVDGNLPFEDSFTYLVENDLKEDALRFLLAFKSVDIPAGTRVILHTEGGTDEVFTRGVPIFLGDGQDTWEGFQKFVGDPNRNQGNKWEIQQISEKPNTKKGKKEEEERDRSRRIFEMFRDAMREAMAKRDISAAAGLLHYGVATAKELGNDDMSGVLTHEFGALRDDILYDMLAEHVIGDQLEKDSNQVELFSSSKTTQKREEKAFLTKIGKLYERRRPEIKKVLSGLGGVWELDFIKRELPVFSRGGNFGIFKQVNTFYVPIITWRACQPGEEDNTDDLVAALCVSNNIPSQEELLSLRDAGVTLGTGEKVKEGENKGERLPPVKTENSIRLQDLGVDDTPIRTYAFQQAYRNVAKLLGESEELLDLKIGTLQAFGMLRTGTSDSGDRGITHHRETNHLVKQLENGEELLNLYFRERRDNSGEREMLRRAAYAELMNASLDRMTQYSVGNNSVTTNTQYMLERSGLYMYGVHAEHGHKFLFMNDQETKRRIENALGTEIDTKRLDTALLLASKEGWWSEGVATLGTKIARSLGVSPRSVQDLGEALKTLEGRAKAREEFGHESILGRLSVQYVKTPSYSRDMINLAKLLCGKNVRLDEYSMSYVGDNGVVLPLAVIQYLGKIIPSQDGWMTDAALAELDISGAEIGNDKLDRIKAVLRKRGVGNSSIYYATTLKDKYAKSLYTSELPRDVDTAPPDTYNQDAINRAANSILSADMLHTMATFLETKTIGDAIPIRDNLLSSYEEAMYDFYDDARLLKSFMDYAKSCMDDMIYGRDRPDITPEGEAAGTYGSPETAVKRAPNASIGNSFEFIHAGVVLSALADSHGIHQVYDVPHRDYEDPPSKYYDKGDFAGGFMHEQRFAFEDDLGDTHYLILNEGGKAVDLIHAHRQKYYDGGEDDALVITPVELKLTTTNQYAHFANSDFLVNAVAGLHNVQQSPTPIRVQPAINVHTTPHTKAELTQLSDDPSGKVREAVGKTQTDLSRFCISSVQVTPTGVTAAGVAPGGKARSEVSRSMLDAKEFIARREALWKTELEEDLLHEISMEPEEGDDDA